MKKLITLGLAAAALTFAGSASWAQSKTIKMALIHPDNQHTEVLAAKAFKAYVEGASGGEMAVQIFYGTMGGAREIAEQLQQGLLDYGSLNEGSLAPFYKQLQVFSIPYVFKSEAIAWNVFDGPFAQKLGKEMEDATGIKVLAMAQNGFRVFSNNVRPIKSPADMAGLRIRIQESPVYVEFIRSLGASAVPMGFPELISSLQQGVIDGQENAPNDIVDTGIIRAQKFMSVNNHIMGVQVVMVNGSFFDGLTDAEKGIVTSGAKLHATALNYLKTTAATKALDLAREAGAEVHVNTAEEKEEFRAASQEPVKAYLASQLGDELVDAYLADIARAEAELSGQ